MIRKTNKKSKKHFKLLVINVGPDGNLKNSIPCQECKKFLIEMGFSHIYCSTENGKIEKLRLEFIPDKMTLAQKQFIKMT